MPCYSPVTAMLLHNPMLGPCNCNVTAQCHVTVLLLQCYCTMPCYSPVTTMLLHNAMLRSCYCNVTAQCPASRDDGTVQRHTRLDTATVHLRRVYLPPTHIYSFALTLPSENQQGRKIKLQIKIFVSDKIRFFIIKPLYPENPSNNHEK